MAGSHGRDRLRARAGVALEGLQTLVAALGHKHHSRLAVLGEVRQRGVAELVERPAAGVAGEEIRRLAVGQPSLSSRRVDIAGGRGPCRGGSQGGEEQRPVPSPANQAGE